MVNFFGPMMVLAIPGLALAGFANVTAPGEAQFLMAVETPGSGSGAAAVERTQFRGDLSCRIRVERTRDGVTLVPTVTASRALSGSYRLSVVSSGAAGGSDVDQSGDFHAAGNGQVVLGTVTIGGGGRYVARLVVKADGRSIECTERIGGSI